MTPVAAPERSGPLRATLVVPGSKSATARGYLLAALADAPSVLRGVLDARDTRLMRAALTALGVGFTDLGPDQVRVQPPDAFTPSDIEVGLAGTLMRFLPPVAALAAGASRFDGDPEARLRPVRPLLDGLAQAGVRIDHPEALPFTVRGTGSVAGGRVSIDASGSSQFVSGLLLAGARFDAGLDLAHLGGTLPSRPHIGLTVAMLRDRGVRIDQIEGEDRWRVAPGPIAARDETIEPDLINAATFLAAPLLLGGEVTTAWPRHTVQAADTILEVLSALGGTVRTASDSVTVSGTGSVRGADLDLSLASELTCVAAALLAVADAPGSIRGVGHVRGHETDRLAALESEINALGGEVSQTADGLRITPLPLRGGIFHTYADHRMAHAGALLGLAVPGLRLDDVSCTTKTLPDFPGLWSRLVDGA
ncbi:MAG: 3-phosphoshikimate 1-carboxyvinyltransferase [Micropruina sp.]|uniref:3-phosphoshikimate 1-carboxyvinyltransferase n=1 Tax=Micropruina sp. TaxID=2737536 RepID=UPI0039E54447